MNVVSRNFSHFRFVITLVSVTWLSACANLPYYAQAIDGHLEVLRRAQPISTIIENPDTDQNLKNSLTKIVQLRKFASRELKLPDNRSYTSYANLERPFVVWNVFASPELSLQLKEWCFLKVGCVNYRGFFSQAKAERYAEELRNEGYDVHVGGVRAYSTLGWFSDPVLNTFISYSEINLARLIFHELAHQVVYVPGDTVFNESFATAVEQEGIKRWFAHSGTVLQQSALNARRERETIFTDLIFKHRKHLQDLFQSDLSEAEKRAGKARIFDELRGEFADLKTNDPELSLYDSWFSQPLNNALLATVSIYSQLVPAFQAILVQNDQDMNKFFDAVTKISKLPKEERNSVLQKATEDHRRWTMVER
ncbi:MAG: aminopeptidase [Nitrosomonas sp.]|jgi:predicted aminopeptidase|uniref:aminopeptidase n=1 Tax=Nitrosomonas sp. TaxID=42353 RepID=UPI001D487B44|nr:aminopeptidase [Nitrosomonas sp.]MBX9893994.1 aminopeptidase [Nitrosomonas sp.]